MRGSLALFGRRMRDGRIRRLDAPPILTAVLVSVTLFAVSPGVASIILIPIDYPTIQAGINAAGPGDTISVAAGVYNESIVVDKEGLLIRGAGAELTILYPALSDPGPAEEPVFGHSQVIVVAASGVEIEDLAVDGDSPTLTPTGILDARNGVILDHTSGDWHSLELRGLEVRNLFMAGIYLRGATLAQDMLVDSLVVSNVNSIPSMSTGIVLRAAAGEVTRCQIDTCRVGIAYLDDSWGYVHANTVWDNDVGIRARHHQGGILGIGTLNNIVNYGSAGIEITRAGGPVSIHSNLVTTTLEPAPGRSAAIAINGESIDATCVPPERTGRFAPEGPGGSSAAQWPHDIFNNTLSGPAQADGSYGVWINTYADGETRDVKVDLWDNDVHFFDVGICLIDDSGDPTGLHDVTVSADSLHPNRLFSNGRFDLMLESCDDPIDATYNDWGLYTPGDIESAIWHQVDDPALGLVTFIPWYEWHGPTYMSRCPGSAPTREQRTTWGRAKHELREEQKR